MTLLTSHTTLPDIFRTFLATMVVKLQTLRRNHFAKLAHSIQIEKLGVQLAKSLTEL